MISIKFGRAGKLFVAIIIAIIAIHYYSFAPLIQASSVAHPLLIYKKTAFFLLLEILMFFIVSFYAFSLLRFIKPLRQFKHAAETLGIDINAKTDAVSTGPAIVRETSMALTQMQARIQNLLASRTQMVAALSHDLRTYLTRLKLRADLAKHSDKIKEMHDDISEMEKLIDDIIWLAKSDAKPLEKVCFDINAFLFDVTHAYQDTGFDVTFVHDGSDANILGNIAALTRLFNNIIDNALKYSENKPVHIKLEQIGSSINIEIIDNGPGLSADELEYLMHQTKDLNIAGSGIGSTIIQEVVKQHQGEITYSNRKEGGAKVVIQLPS